MKIAELYRNLNPTSIGAERVEGLRSDKKESGVGGIKSKQGNSEFEKVLQQQQQVAEGFQNETKLNLSQHAETRIRSREIPWDRHLENRIAQALDQAASKGSREALILAGDVAVIANVSSRTIVTAMDRSQMKEKIFTNIDSAVLV